MTEALNIGEQTVAAWDPAADLGESYRRHMSSLVHLNGPSANTRASSIGNECERYLVYERTVPADQRVRYSPELAAIFELGKDMEKIAIRRLEDMGAEIVQRGRDYLDRRYELSGHIDAKIRMPGWPRAVPAEIKGLNPYTGESIHSLDDIKNSRQAWVRKYYDQQQSYLFLEASELGVFVLFNKSTGWPHFINTPLDYAYAEQLLKKAERVALHVRNDTLPDRHLSKECQRCQFLPVCNPPLDYGQGVVMLDNGELEALVRRRIELDQAASEWESLDKEIKAALPKAEGEFLIGEYVITSSEIVKRAEAKPRAGYTYYRRDIRRIGDVRGGK